MTKKDLIETLEVIAQYTFPTYTFNGTKYIPLQNALFLRNQARLALGQPTDVALLESMVPKTQ